VDLVLAWRAAREISVSTVRSFLDGHALDFAASIAYRVLFSVFPLAIILVGLFGAVARATGVQADAVDAIVEQVPLTEEGQEDLRELLLTATGDLGAVGLVGLVGFVWAASGMMTATRKATAFAWGVEHRRSFVRGKALDVLLVFGASIPVVLSLALSIAFTAALDATIGVLGWLEPAAVIASWLLGLVVPALLAFAVILFAYRVLPPTRPSLRRVLPGAVFAGVAFAVLQQLFALYLRAFADYDVVYGSLGAVIASLLFVYLAAAVFLLGRHLARRWPDALEQARGEVRVDAP
jgi:membrane protein